MEHAMLAEPWASIEEAEHLSVAKGLHLPVDRPIVGYRPAGSVGSGKFELSEGEERFRVSDANEANDRGTEERKGR